MLPESYFPQDLFQMSRNQKMPNCLIMAFLKFSAAFPGLINGGPWVRKPCLEGKQKLPSLVEVAGEASPLLLAKTASKSYSCSPFLAQSFYLLPMCYDRGCFHWIKWADSLSGRL